MIAFLNHIYKLADNINVYVTSAPLYALVISVEVYVDNCVCAVMDKSACICCDSVAINCTVSCDDIELCALRNYVRVNGNITDLCRSA